MKWKGELEVLYMGISKWIISLVPLFYIRSSLPLKFLVFNFNLSLMRPEEIGEQWDRQEKSPRPC
jgi:hypothetical protein